MDKANGGILEAIARYISYDPVRMHMPGHKGRSSSKHLGHDDEAYGGPRVPGWGSALGDGSICQIARALEDALDRVKAMDVTEIPGLDNLHYPSEVIQQVQRNMADVFGTAATYCLVNGATSGILASLIALRMTMGPGVVIVPRNAHRSIISGLILSGLDPLFIYPEYDQDLGGYLPLKVSDVEMQLAEATSQGRLRPGRRANIRGIVAVSPTYTGVCGDIRSICQYAGELNVPVIVDEAHGTLFRFSDRLPPSAIETGASLVIHGAHKTTQAFTQTGLLHVTLSCVKTFPALAANVEEALRLVQSTSPSYILLASLERAIAGLKQDASWVESMIQSAHLMKQELSKIKGIRVRTPEEGKWDPGKILIDVSGLGLSGPQVQQLLWEKARVVPEMTGPDYVVLMVTGADNNHDLERVAGAFCEISESCRGGRVASQAGVWELLTREPPRGEAVISLSQAFYAPARECSLDQAVGKISGDTVLIYPPGSPVVVPGERMTAEVVGYIRQAVECGLDVLGRGHSGGEKELKVFCIED
ncbi:MAG: aminotransferase class I/II-fold pyridoxal phosphate-dependent enzyme [Bacillota bacterium]